MGNGLRFTSEAALPSRMRDLLAAQRERDGTAPIVIVIEARTPTMNVWQRLHWSQRQKLGREFATLIALACQRRPATPLAKCTITIERYSPKNPDRDGRYGGVKPVLDALQPLSKRHPYGLGFIEDDNDDCVTDLKVLHVKSSLKRTRITITPVLT
ncbi:hypothetical protein SAMN04487785_102407 [Dyella jiangningensis]|uniref:hypothetical protein n=1 Tax=Dyella sp. AtDHG13 TaxID=1938897 RepID=UPI000891B862|nr:hypothetical protein [Dyella sp. AtDHG13]PXV60679.1 hypothetical protein BDW41_102406 [Dyella sp. AtDHG13]SDJ54829.1 hypothetical protein SAMN04487785_102407 [Dyella jiangningensis]